MPKPERKDGAIRIETDVNFKAAQGKKGSSISATTEVINFGSHGDVPLSMVVSPGVAGVVYYALKNMQEKATFTEKIHAVRRHVLEGLDQGIKHFEQKQKP